MCIFQFIYFPWPLVYAPKRAGLQHRDPAGLPGGDGEAMLGQSFYMVRSGSLVVPFSGTLNK